MPGPSFHGQSFTEITGEGVLGERAPWEPGGLNDQPRFIGLPKWAQSDNRGRVKFIRELAREYGADPRMRWYTANMLESQGVAPRDYPGMARVILKHVQKNVYYTQESGEQLQSPWRTLQARNGDCDDMAITIAAMAESVGLPWEMAIAGVDANGQTLRWVYGSPWKAGSYSHIYPILGWPPGQPRKWVAAEPTMQVPLGYDVTIHGADFDAHGRPSARAVQLDSDGIAVVPGVSPEVIVSAAAAPRRGGLKGLAFLLGAFFTWRYLRGQA